MQNKMVEKERQAMKTKGQYQVILLQSFYGAASISYFLLGGTFCRELKKIAAFMVAKLTSACRRPDILILLYLRIES